MHQVNYFVSELLDLGISPQSNAKPFDAVHVSGGKNTGHNEFAHTEFLPLVSSLSLSHFYIF